MKKRLLALALASAMVFSLAACGSSDNSGESTTPATEGSSVATDATDDGATYTLNYGVSAFPTNWNPHQYQTATDADYMLGYLTAGFYTFDFNETMDGYDLIPYMITTDPEDVTADFVGQYGLEDGETARAWKLTLRDDLKWQDGSAITAQDFVTSAQLLLNPEASNYRADSLYSGNLEIVNAKNYLYAGQHAYASTMISADLNSDEYIAVADLTVDENGVFTVDGNDVAINLNDGANWGSDGLAAYHASESYAPLFLKDGVDVFTEILEPAADADGYVQVTQEVYEAVSHVIAGLHGYESAEAYAAAAGDYAYLEWEEFCYLGETYAEMDFAEVGLTALSDTELVLVLARPLSGFYLHYSLTDSWLVNEELYTSCITMTDGVYTNSYGTSAETTMSYGPYKLDSFQADKEYTFSKNEYYFDQGEGLWQTTNMTYQYIAEPTTRLEMFLSGQIDNYSLSADDMATYATSDNTYYQSTPSTFYIALNPDMDALTSSQAALGDNFNKTILTVKEFRQALCYALDRSAFALAVSPTNNAAYGLFSDLIICDPEEGTGYRSTEEAKHVLVDFWGLTDEIGDGKMYATIDDAIASITGYNLEMAKEYFNAAYDIAIAEGLMDADDTVQIMIGLPNSESNFYSKGYDFLVNCYTDAVVGTSLEGKLTFTMDDTLGNGFGDALRANQVDLLFGVGWSGSALDPYGLMEAYTTEQYRYNKCWDTEAETLTINIDGTDYTASVLDWTTTLSGEEITITAADGSTTTFKGGSSDDVDATRFQILVSLENAVLQTYDMIPMIDNSSASLKSMKITYYSEEYIYGVGRGGERYTTFNYTDEEWAQFVADQGGTLNYN